MLPALLMCLSLICAVLAGVFLSFSDFVMRSLHTAARPAGVEVMQIINREIYRSVFMGLFGLMVLVSLAGLVWGLWSGPRGVPGAVALAGGVYLLGAFGVTAFGHVPMNGRLDAMPIGSRQARGIWPMYQRAWRRLNHLRWLSCLVAAACYGCASLWLAGAQAV